MYESVCVFVCLWACVYEDVCLCEYLSHFEELWQLRHPVKKLLVDVQSVFALVLLHVKVFLYRDGEEREDEEQENETKI